LLNGYLKIAVKIGSHLISESNLTETAERVLVAWLQDSPRSLLVLDNLEDSSVVRGFLASTDGYSHTLITTRNPNAIGIPAVGLEVDLLDPVEAIDLLLPRIGPTPHIRSAERENSAK